MVIAGHARNAGRHFPRRLIVMLFGFDANLGAKQPLEGARGDPLTFLER